MAKKKQQPSFAQEKVDWAINVLYNSSKDRDRFFQKLDQYQKYYLENIYSKSVVFVDAPAGTGKAQPLTSNILGENGWIKMGDINIGDKIFGEDGKLHNVVGVYPQGEKDVYEVIFNDGTSAKCCKEHLWSYQTPNMRNTGNNYKTETLETIIKKPLYKKSGNYKKWQVYIPITKPVEFQYRNIKINPYVLGVLLGDGCFGESITVSLYEDDIKNKLEKILEDEGFNLIKISEQKMDYRITDNNKIPKQYIKGKYSNRLINALDIYNLRHTRSNNKFIPNEYKFNSPDIRLSILQGLIDTDGEIYGESCIYSTVSLQLASDVVFLVQSLGGTATLKTKESHYTYNNIKKDGQLCYRLYIKMPKHIKIFSSEKHNKHYSINQTQVRRTIREIKFVGKEQCQCIMTDNPTHLYITDNFIVTHNTTIAVLAGLELLRQGKVSKITYVRFPDKRYAKLGFLTGCKEEKEEILMNPFYEAAAECGMQPEAVNRLAEKGFIEATTDIGMRGRNLKTSFVIIDEAQNGTIDDLKLLLTRIHDRDCKAIVIGHSGQCDNPPKLYAGKYNAFQVYQIHMTKKAWAVKCDLPNNYRGEISQHADNVDETIKELEQIMLTNTQ